MAKNLRIIIAQLNFLVGDIKGNYQKILEASAKARDEMQADLIIFPELALTGYPPEDLLLRADFIQEVQHYLKYLTTKLHDIHIIVGYPERADKNLYNAAAVIGNNKIIANYRKQCLPNYGVFDEKRYFVPGSTACVFNLKGINFGLTICEDIWYPEPIQKSVQAGADIIISINASPFDVHKVQLRENIIKQRIRENKRPIIFVHQVGGQDEIVFDGRSLVINEKNEICHFASRFHEELIPVDITIEKPPQIIPANIVEKVSIEEKAYKALTIGLRDYIEKNNFPGVLIGLSGGIDSALTAAIAVDALGPARVHTVFMPSRYTADMSAEDSAQLAKNLGVKYSIVPIESLFETFLTTLAPEFANASPDTTEENIQARIRGTLLMALSNKFGKLVLTTGNKSEMAVGYATLYGDMAGGFAILKDVYKTLVYDLVRYRNSITAVIPERIIHRPPSAELAFEQTDQDSLPPYAILDQILERYVERDESIAMITAAGFDEETVRKVIRLVDRNEYKRRQAPPGVKITTRAFGRDRRYPITNGYRQ